MEIVQLKIHALSPWDTKKMHTEPLPTRSKPTVNIYICSEDDAVFDKPTTYRERMMSAGSYRGHHFGPPAKLTCIDDRNIALSHPDPGTIIWSLVVKYVLTVHAILSNMLHLKGASVRYKDKAFLILGRGGSGKTEMARALCRNGASLIANTHLLIDGPLVCGIRSNVRVRHEGREEYVAVGQQGQSSTANRWLPIGTVFWVSYRTDGQTVVERMPAPIAQANLRYFGESISNWEIKEDMADHVGSDPFQFAESVNRVDELLSDFCRRNEFHYLSLDIHGDRGSEPVIALMEASLRR